MLFEKEFRRAVHAAARARTANPYTCHLPVTGPDANGWLPIESAPRDGTEVLAWANRDWVLCWWVSGKNGEGWVLGWETASGYDVGWNFTSPTHWQPLPPPPAQGPEQ